MPRKLRVCIAVDPSSGSSKRSNFFVVAVVGMDLYTMKLHVLDIFRERVPIHMQAAKVVEYVRRWKPEGLWKIAVEAVFRQSDLVREVERLTRLKVEPIYRHKDKETRLAGLAMRYAAHDVIHPEDSQGNNPPWLEAYEAEILEIGWEKGIQLHEQDDQADAVNDACDLLTYNLPALPSEPQYHSFSVDRRPETPAKRWRERMKEMRRRQLEERLAQIEER